MCQYFGGFVCNICAVYPNRTKFRFETYICRKLSSFYFVENMLKCPQDIETYTYKGFI